MSKSTTVNPIGFVLCRVVVPLWILTGAVFKLMEKTPKLLPENIWSTAAELHVNLYWLLATLIALELLAVGVMFFLRRWARPMAIFMLASFCLILIGEILAGNTDCGCLGANSPSPWVMLAIDGVLLLGVLYFRPVFDRAKSGSSLAPMLAGAWIVAGFVVSAMLILPENNTTLQGDDSVVDNGDVNSPPPPPQLPSYFLADFENWQGKRWDELELPRYMNQQPSDFNSGRRYVIFYSKSCDHCQELFATYFGDASPVPTTMVAIPENKDGFNTEGELPMTCVGCEKRELRIGSEWLITPPAVVALEDGVVQCAKEGESTEEPECLIWH